MTVLRRLFGVVLACALLQGASFLCHCADQVKCFTIPIECYTTKNKSVQKSTYWCSFAYDQKNRVTQTFVRCLPKSLSNLPRDCRKKFKRVHDDPCFGVEICLFGTDYDFYEASNQQLRQESELPFSPNDRLRGEGPSESLSLELLAELIRTKQGIVYTGAGLSAGLIPTENQLFELLNLPRQEDEEVVSDEEASRKYSQFLLTLIRKPKEVIKNVDTFFTCLYSTEPTEAYKDLAKILNTHNKLYLVTENMDELHQKTGLHPLCFGGLTCYLGNETLEEFIQTADFILTIGLSDDQSGFLFYSTSLNPDIQIISIDIKQPNYLRENDFFLKGDCQTMIPFLWRILQDSLLMVT